MVIGDRTVRYVNRISDGRPAAVGTVVRLTGGYSPYLVGPVLDWICCLMTGCLDFGSWGAALDFAFLLGDWLFCVAVRLGMVGAGSPVALMASFF